MRTTVPTGGLSILAAANRLGVTVSQVRYAANKGFLPRSCGLTAEGARYIRDWPTLVEEWEARYSLGAGQVPAAPVAEDGLDWEDPVDEEDTGESTGGDAGHVAEPQTSKDKLEHYKALREKLRYEKELGQLIPAAAIESKLVATYTRVRTRLQALPGRLRQRIPELGDVGMDLATLLVTEALEELERGDD